MYIVLLHACCDIINLKQLLKANLDLGRAVKNSKIVRNYALNRNCILRVYGKGYLVY